MYSRFMLVYSRGNISQKIQPDSNLLFVLPEQKSPRIWEFFSLQLDWLSHLPLQVGPAPNNGQRLQDQHSSEGNDAVANDAKKSVPPAGCWWIANGRWVNGWWINFNLDLFLWRWCGTKTVLMNHCNLGLNGMLYCYTMLISIWGFWWCRVHRTIFVTILSWNITKEQVIWSCVKIPAMKIRRLGAFLSSLGISGIP